MKTKAEDRIEAALLAHAMAFGVMEDIDLKTAIQLVRELYESGGVKAEVREDSVYWSAEDPDAVKVFGLKVALYKHTGTSH